MLSPPSRRRGLKHSCRTVQHNGSRSPPSRRRGLKRMMYNGGYMTFESPPSRRRGLKHPFRIRIRERRVVASLAEAWIETSMLAFRRSASRSPPSRRRGLKLLSSSCLPAMYLSPPSRRRGLKLPVLRKGNQAHGRLPRGGVD